MQSMPFTISNFIENYIQQLGVAHSLHLPKKVQHTMQISIYRVCIEHVPVLDLAFQAAVPRASLK